MIQRYLSLILLIAAAALALAPSALASSLTASNREMASPQASEQAATETPATEAPATETPASEATVTEPGQLENAKSKFKGEFQSLFNDPAGTLKRWAVKDGPHVLGRILLFFLILLISRIVAGIAGSITEKALKRSAKKASELFRTFVVNSVTKLVFFIGLVLALQNIGLDVAPLIAGLGVMGFIVGFALQDTLGNFAAGIMLLLYRPYDVGDFVEVASKEGTVEAMTLVSTTLLTLDNQRLTVPNGKIWGDVIRNATANPRRRMNETVGIGYDDEISKAERIAMEVVSSMEHVIDDPAPQVLVTSLGDSSVNLSIRAWVPTKEYFASCCELRRSIKLRFDEENITIPYPQRDVHLHQLAGATET